MTTASALSALRVVDLGDMLAGPLCARLLGDAGADVIKVEPPAGDGSRRRGPFPDGKPDPGSSGLYMYLNANKRGLALDLDRPQGLRFFRDLVAQADVLVLGQSLASVERLRLRREHLKSLNPRLIVTIITPFGTSGPYRDYAGDDLVAVASGGLAYATPGIPDMVHDPETELPLRADTPISEYLAGIQAAIATMVAVMSRSLDGEGREVDVSHQEAVAMIMTWEVGHASYLAPKRREPVVFGAAPNAYLPCKDGYVVVVGWMRHHWQRLVEVMGNPDWAESEVFGDPAERARNWDALEPLLLEWTMAHSGEEIVQVTQAAGVPCFRAYTVGEMVESEQVKQREYLHSHLSSNGTEITLPGYPVRMGATPWQLRRSAPKLGEHTGEVLQEWLNCTPSEIKSLEGCAVH